MSIENALAQLVGTGRLTALKAACRAWPSLVGAALAMESRALGAPSIPHLFARDIQRVPPSLNDDLLELYARARQALANRFGFFGETETFEPDINWLPARSKAWRGELHAFDYALDLALTFRISGDTAYAHHLRYLVASWIASNSPGSQPGWSPHALARRIRNWALAADLCRNALEPDAQFCEVFFLSLAQQATYLDWETRHVDDRRTRLAASRALLFAGRFFARGEALLDAARKLLTEALAEGPSSFPDHPQPLRQFELASTCADHALFCESDDAMPRAAFSKSLEELESMLHPDGTLPLFGREPLPAPEAVAAAFSLGAATLGAPRWKSLAGGEIGLLPFMFLGHAGLQRFESLPRETWRADSRLDSRTGIYRLGDGESSALLINSTVPVSALDHHDLFSFELTVRGQKTIVDSGVVHATGRGPEDDLTAAVHHNIATVDGRVVVAKRVQAAPIHTPGVEGLWLSAGAGHARGAFLLEGKYWIIMDRLDSPPGRRIESLLHFYPAFEIGLRHDGARARSGAVSVDVIPLGRPGADLTLSLATPGCYAPTPGTRYPSPVLQLSAQVDSPVMLLGWLLSAEMRYADHPAVLQWAEDGFRLVMQGKEFVIPGSFPP